MIFNSVLDTIGNTPLVRLHNIEKKYNVKGELYANSRYSTLRLQHENTDSMQRSECGNVLVKLYLQKQVVGCIWAVGHILPVLP